MEPKKSSNVVWHHATITREDRERLNGHKGCILWMTGLSGAGKSTLAHAIEERLHRMGCRTYVLDGDNVRHGLNGDLGFSPEDREENIRRIGEVAKLMMEAGVIAITAFISPYRKDRDKVRAMVGEGDFIEIYCQAPLEVCEQRDVKGLYQKARAGEIPEFTGISAPYEAPEDPELLVRTGEHDLESCTGQVIDYLRAMAIINPA